MRLFAVLLVVSVRADTCGSCGQGCADCGHLDFGSCGNACCKLDVTIAQSTEEVVATLNATLQAPGFADGAYEAQQLAEGVLGFADLRPFNASADFIGQFRHTTTIGYEDSVSINVARDSDGHSLVRMFSYSLIGGAFGDAGQNYKNLFNLLTSAYAGQYTIAHADASCGGSA